MEVEISGRPLPLEWKEMEEMYIVDLPLEPWVWEQSGQE
jgi:hypothetical protein